MGRDRDGALGLGDELVAVDGGAWDALGFGLRIGIGALRGGGGAAAAGDLVGHVGARFCVLNGRVGRDVALVHPNPFLGRGGCGFWRVGVGRREGGWLYKTSLSLSGGGHSYEGPI